MVEFTAFNRGISGDSTHHVPERMEDVYVLVPSVVVLLIGINDFVNEGRTVDNTAAKYGYTYIEIYPLQPDSMTGCSDRCYTDDSVHPNTDGCRVISELLTPYIREQYHTVIR